MKYKAVLLDIDDTLYDYHFAHEAALNTLKDVFYDNFKISENEFIDLYNTSRAFFNTTLKGTASSHNRLLYIQKMLEVAKLDIFKYSLELHDLYWTTFIKNIKLFNGVLDFLKENAACICFLTDLTVDIQLRKLQSIKVVDSNFRIVTSEEVGHEKPSHMMFQAALDKLELQKNEVIMIGDNYEKDILGANDFGIDSIWLNHKNLKRNSCNIKTTEFNNFSDVVNFLI